MSGSDPFLADTDGDGFNDNVELINGSNPRDSLMTPVVFATTTTLATGIKATSIAVLNMNQDAYTDILLGTLAGDLYTYAGNGIGTFAATPIIFNSGATGMHQFATGLVNQDSYTDVVMPSDTNGTVVVMYNDGLGVFSPYTFTVDLYAAPKSVAIADLNNDGYADIVAPNFGATGTGNTISSLSGLGGTQFTLDPYTTVSGASGLYAITVMDFNFDGYTDAAITGRTSNTLTTMLGAAVSAPISTNYTIGTTPEHVMLGDWNNDDILDIIVSNKGSASISILLGDVQTSAFSPPTTITLPLGTETPLGLAIGDVDGDFINDIVVADPVNNQILLLKNDGTGNVASFSTYAVPNSPIDVKLADINNDGKLDVVTINAINITIILNGLVK